MLAFWCFFFFNYFFFWRSYLLFSLPISWSVFMVAFFNRWAKPAHFVLYFCRLRMNSYPNLSFHFQFTISNANETLLKISQNSKWMNWRTNFPDPLIMPSAYCHVYSLYVHKWCKNSFNLFLSFSDSKRPNYHLINPYLIN